MGIFSPKIPAGKNPAGKNEKLSLLVDIHFYTPLNEILSYLNKKLSFRIFENPRGEIFRTGKNPGGDGEKSPRGNILLHYNMQQLIWDLQIPAGILTLVMEYFLGHYRF